jgi:hypothetical protein
VVTIIHKTNQTPNLHENRTWESKLTNAVRAVTAKSSVIHKGPAMEKARSRSAFELLWEFPQKSDAPRIHRTPTCSQDFIQQSILDEKAGHDQAPKWGAM